MGISDSISDWISAGNEGEWSFTNPTDAQRESYLFLGASFLVILTFWQGIIPYWIGFTVVKNVETGAIRRKVKFHTFHIPPWLFFLLPFKILTVLYHEICHAVIGKLSILWREVRHGVKGERGRIEFIMVDGELLVYSQFCPQRMLRYVADRNSASSEYEGGLTQFGGGTEPNMWLTLPAGYLGSCLFGCWFLFTGFDAKCILVCAFVRAKSGVKDHWHRLCAGFYRFVLCNQAGADKQLRKHAYKRDQKNEHANYHHNEDPDGPTEHDLHASQDRIMICSLVVGVLIWLAWNWNDSIYLRFVMLFIGLMNASYALWDVIQDGIMGAKDLEGEAGKKSTRFVATIWLIFELLITLSVLLLAYYVFHRNKAEQALESREFLPAQFPYGPADLKNDASFVGDKIEGTYKGIVGDDGNMIS
ncbi:hypothetical protein I316_07217 [Kwoniella heveanensis BCC8398]|uniref:Uncharacterized protein n=1 Tax=Kwoniella heveanensis BCC8398 TaxID=1296120 RepID=A0A1B9GJE8_9TREE|nr:hypothetical protein I316_07217 [Kwoniella heveanensis BCC8398]